MITVKRKSRKSKKLCHKYNRGDEKMEVKQNKLEKERNKALGDLLVAECKSKSVDINAQLETIETILTSGAMIDYKNSQPLYFACKLHKFGLVKYLIDKGACVSGIARSYIATMCDYKGFNDELEPQYFEILDMVHTKTGDYMGLFTPYINSMAVSNRYEKLAMLAKRYYLSDYEVVDVIHTRIVFEMVKSQQDDMLEYISSHKRWINKDTFELAISSGESEVLIYMIESGEYFEPSDEVVSKAVYEGFFDCLNALLLCGYSFNRKEVFLEKACRATLTRGTKSIEYLLHNGYAVGDMYKGKTMLQHAEIDGNEPLIAFFEAI